MSPVIKANRNWNFERIRTMCIKHNFYNAGTNEDYEKLAKLIGNKVPTYLNIYKVADDIRRHTNNSPGLTTIMRLIESECVFTSFKVILSNGEIHEFGG